MFGVPSIIDQVGFVEPGHGAKGRLSVPEDLDDMYSMHKARREILLWCPPESSGGKPSGKPSGKREPSRNHSLLLKRADQDMITTPKK